MKIDQPTKPLNSVSSPANAASSKDNAVRAASADAAAAGTATSASPPMPAALNSLSAQVRQLQTQLLQPGAGDFDAAKVAEIRQAISEGRYQINPGKIADGLLDTVRDLLGKKPS
ncbi:flagellar biosynthesis anti-sigma factor FlgM [Collimonas fungivorans]|uniref:Negative regulator of flagellin synthesis n=1 Tax=Collimonas fungivorans (strain Ter331) TaxID=1005048 RepID=G0AII6_COLFT|nr:flagellar biosynthesis anti-sigma factor FlgM [Collimonas fungivorans]AEK60769.1 Negative regulator of flagellin synthesis [Collimonas fungivorans Ter331]